MTGEVTATVALRRVYMDISGEEDNMLEQIAAERTAQERRKVTKKEVLQALVKQEFDRRSAPKARKSKKVAG